MQTPIKDFCQKYKNSLEPDNRYKPRFWLAYHMTGHLTGEVYPLSGIFELDNEDMEYLFNKYSKRLQEEKDRQLKQIDAEYNL